MEKVGSTIPAAVQSAPSAARATQASHPAGHSPDSSGPVAQGATPHVVHGAAGSPGLRNEIAPASTHPRHLGAATEHGTHGFQERALAVLAKRQEVIASNIANADTPGYKAVDIDFREALHAAMASREAAPAPVVTTHAKHVPGTSVSFPLLLKYHVPTQASVDGNTVEMDVERAKFAENALRYEFALDRVKDHYMHMQDLLKNLK